ncbi:MAG: hypothetical protein C0501_04555 [Isosphaera sp.]|nr:hypothetical protein [Isosphaera sp.]
MSARFLAWYTCGALAFVLLLSTAISVHPDFETGFRVIQLAVGASAAAFAVIGIVLGQLPREHWCNRSRTVRVALSITAVIASLLLLG